MRRKLTVQLLILFAVLGALTILAPKVMAYIMGGFVGAALVALCIVATMPRFDPSDDRPRGNP